MYLKKHFKNQRGFTLIELIVVMVIIGILAATILPRVMGAPSRAKDTGRIAQLRDLSLALKSYYSDKKEYPEATSGECINVDTGIGRMLVDSSYISAGNFPTDPNGNSTTSGLCVGANAGNYWYKTVSKSGITNAGFILIADVEGDGQANAKLSCKDETTLEAANTCIRVGVGVEKGINAIYLVAES